MIFKNSLARRLEWRFIFSQHRFSDAETRVKDSVIFYLAETKPTGDDNSTHVAYLIAHGISITGQEENFDAISG